MSVTIETLTCGRCGTSFDRERRRGVKPKHCASCTQILADEAKAAEQAEERLQTLHCQSCDQDWTRPAQRGKPPRFCPDCTPGKVVTYTQERQAIQRAAEATAVNQVTPIQTASNGHYHVDRLLEQYNLVPVEEVYKFTYIEAELDRTGIDSQREKALKRVWATLEGRLS